MENVLAASSDGDRDGSRRQTDLLAGAWSWFSDPRAICIGESIFAGAISPHGDVRVSGASPLTLHASFETDDHDNPALLRRNSDGRIIACYARHGVDNNYFQRVSIHPDDPTSFGPERNIGVALGGAIYTYANLIEIEDGMFNFLRCETAGERVAPHFTKSVDAGANWTRVIKLLTNADHRPYITVAKTGANRIDIICTDGHPGEADTNSVYHFFYEEGDWRKSDGSSLGVPPFVPSQLTKIHDGAIKGWTWDLVGDRLGFPVAVYATFPHAPTDHRYRYARWNGQAWISHEVCAAGGTIYPVGDEREPFYSGGICIDPDDGGVIYCSRETGTAGSHRNNGTFQLWRGVTADGGATWSMTQLTDGQEDCIRPHKLAGTRKLLFLRGRYSSYTHFATQVAALDL